VYKFTPGGVGSLFAGPGSGLSSPVQLTFHNGSLFVANYGGDDILKFDLGGNGTMYASTGSGYTNPLGLAFDNTGDLYVACAGNFMDRFDSSGNGVRFASTDNGPWMLAVQPVPEPASMALFLLAGGAVLLRRGARREPRAPRTPLRCG